MPDSSHPPYSPNSITIPRQLNKWLDVNSQNGPLRRVETFITLPAFTVNYTWRGYSDLIAAFNFEGPNNFSLRDFSELVPLNSNYTLCIMWVDNQMNVNRYSIWRNIEDVFYFPLIPYTGQQIKKNFRLEIWSANVNPSTVSQSNSLNFYTTKLGDIDYRYGVDFSLVNADAIVTNFADNIQTVSPLPHDFGVNFRLQQFKASVGFISPNWTSNTDVNVLTGAGSSLVNIPPNFGSIPSVKANGTALVCNIFLSNPTVNYLFVLAYLDGSTGVLYEYNNSPVITVGVNSVSVGATNIPLPSGGVNRLYLIYTDFIAEEAFVIDYLTREVSSRNLIGEVVPTPSTIIQAMDTTSSFSIVDAVAYNTCANIQGVLNYFYTTYGGFTLPLTFPANAVPQPNT